MKWASDRKLALLMAFHMLWGFALWFSISKYGLGISTDSVHFLFGGLNFSAGKGLVSFDGSFLLGWPPLYPLLLGLIHSLSGLDVFASAAVLQAAAFIVLSLSLSILFLRIFPGNFLLACAGTVLSDIGVVVLSGFNIVGPDYVHLALVVFYLWWLGVYLENRSARILIVLSVIGMLVALERYLGVAVIATGAVLILFFSSGSVAQRMIRSFFVSLSVLPAGVWLFITSRLIERRAPISFGENFSWFSRSILEWFFPFEAVKPHLVIYIVCLWIVILGLSLLIVLSSSHFKLFTSFTKPLFIFGIIYVLSLFGSASFTYFNKLGGRFLLPLYIPFVALITAAASIPLKPLTEEADRRPFPQRFISACTIVGLVIVAALLLQITLPVALESHAVGAAGGENIFNTRAWHQNEALNYWLSHPPQGKYSLFSNYPDGVAFYTQHDCYPAPRKFSGPYGKEEFPVSQYTSELFSSGQPVYILWIEPNDYSYYYKVDELNSIATIERLFENEDGGVYRLMPVSGS